jgi:transposase
VVRGDDAGRDGCWLHRSLQAQGLTTQGVDSSALAGNRRKRRAKSDGLDVRKLLTMLMRLHHGERDVWRVGPVPTVEAEEQRPLPRDVETRKQERASTTTRSKGLLRSQGRRLTSLRKLPEPRAGWRLWDGSPIPSGRRRRLRRV